MKGLLKFAIGTGFLLFYAKNSFAAEINQKEIDLLKQRLTILEKQVEENQKSDVTVSLKGAPSFKTLDGNNSFALDGRIMVDAGSTTNKKSSDGKNTIGLRRFWIGLGGKIDKDWKYRGLVGFENNQTAIADAWLSYGGFKNLNIIAGNFFENNGIEISTPNQYSTFMELSAGVTTFRPIRRTGVSVDPYGDNWGTHFGVFGSAPNNSATNDKGQGFSGRAHVAPFNEEGHYLHLGVNGTYRTPDASDKSIRFNSTGDSTIINRTLVDSGKILNVANYQQYMGEFRYQLQSFTLTSEYIKTYVNRSDLTNLNFSGGYVMASYFLTGEKYGYDAKNGTVNRPKIESKGAWEIATRYSLVNLNNKDINGGKLNSYEFGVNYYANNHVKFMMNYIFNRLENSTLAYKRNPQYLMFRAQVDF